MLLMLSLAVGVIIQMEYVTTPSATEYWKRQCNKDNLQIWFRQYDFATDYTTM